MPQPLPTNGHDLALLLCKQLVKQQRQGDMVEGVLPDEFDFASVESALDLHDLKGVCDVRYKKIAFHPAWAGVYMSLDELISHHDNARKSPAKFSLLDISYSHGQIPPQPIPPMVTFYLNACQLYELLMSVADHVGDNAHRLMFIQSHEAKLEINLRYSSSDLGELDGLTEFEKEFIESASHREQKTAIIRSVLLEIFRGRKSIYYADVLQKFRVFMERLRSSYSMYVAEFSFAKVKAEVEKDNLDSTLKLNKTFSDIQNQLLALPVAVLLVGGQMIPSGEGLTIKNGVIWLGALVFSKLMFMLIGNQRDTLKAVGSEISLRYEKIKEKPPEIADKFNESFEELRGRQTKQDNMLRSLELVVLSSLILSTALLAWYSYEREIRSISSIALDAWLSCKAAPVQCGVMGL